MCPKTGHTGGKCVFIWLRRRPLPLFCQLLLQPILAVDVARDDEGDDVVARRVDHGRGGSTRLPSASAMGKATARWSGKKMEHKTSSPVPPPPGMPDMATEENTATMMARMARPVVKSWPNMPNRNATLMIADMAEPSMCIVAPRGDDDVGDVLGDTGLLGDFHVGRDRRDGRAGAERHGSRPEQLGEHGLRRALAAAEAGVDRGGDEHVDEAQDVIDRERAAVVADEVGAVVGDQIREEAEEADGRVVGDDLEGLHDAVGDVVEQLRGLGLRAASHLHAEAEENGRHDERQNGPAAEQLGEVRLREEVDDHVGHAQRAADLTPRSLHIRP